MSQTKLLEEVQILQGPNSSISEGTVLISNNAIAAFGEQAKDQAAQLGIKPTDAKGQLLAPCLVDPHSILEEPINGRSETLESLTQAAASCGYGQIALLPRSSSWRDHPERIQGFSKLNNEVLIHLWGNFSLQGKGKELTPHGDLLKSGAIGLADDDYMIPIELLQRGILLNEINGKPILLAPRDKQLQGLGEVRESVETLRAGWIPDPIISETIPLGNLLEIHRQYPQSCIRLMNISTADSIKMLKTVNRPPMSTVCWWHLVNNRNSLKPHDLGWRIVPSIGGNEDREALIGGLNEGIITGIAVHSVPLDEEEVQLPPEEQTPGLAGHHLVLPMLWNELVIKSGISIEQLWNFLSFGPSKILNLPEESLACGSRRWLLFDPQKSWIQNKKVPYTSHAANQPLEGSQIIGQVIDCGLKNF